MYVYEALFTEQWESDRSYGLFLRKADAKKACQDEATNDSPDKPALRWDNTRRNYATVPFWNGSFAVWRRRVN